jgi:PAS domain-containing protein
VPVPKSGFGPTALRVTGEELYATVHPDDHEPARRARETAFASGGSYEHEFRRIGPGGSIGFVNAHIIRER